MCACQSINWKKQPYFCFLVVCIHLCSKNNEQYIWKLEKSGCFFECFICVKIWWKECATNWNPMLHSCAALVHKMIKLIVIFIGFPMFFFCIFEFSVCFKIKNMYSLLLRIPVVSDGVFFNLLLLDIKIIIF